MNLETLKISQRYHHYTRADLSDLIQQTVEHPEENPDPVWQAWLISYCLHDLRPHTLNVNTKEWCRWLAFVLRFIQPLISNQSRAETRPVIEVMRQRPDVLRTLLFGPPEHVRLALESAYELHDDYRQRLPAAELRQDQQELMGRVRKDIQELTERTLTGWSRYYLDGNGNALADRLYTLFHQPSFRPLPTILQMIAQPRKQRSLSGSRFEAYLAFAMKGQAEIGLVGQALGYLNEFERRTAITEAYARLFLRATLLLLCLFSSGVILLLPAGIIGELVVVICWGLGLLDLLLIGVILAATVLYAYESHTWAITALNTLEMLMGSVEAHIDEPNEASQYTIQG